MRLVVFPNYRYFREMDVALLEASTTNYRANIMSYCHYVFCVCYYTKAVEHLFVTWAPFVISYDIIIIIAAASTTIS